mmetsp:Transcript_27779/g.39749  ORF Transcript_27779/g.39749 Transcript_27779/m.39749 type:complete len:634 (+) Transcript_27779:185-2086(+)
MLHDSRKSGKAQYFPWRQSKTSMTAFIFAAAEILLTNSTALAGWIDPDTQLKFRSAKPLTLGDNREFTLVFSDEFEREGRTFRDGDDPRWTAIDKNDYTNAALHFYSSENVKTENGALNITTTLKTNSYVAFDEDKKIFYTDKKHIQSAMLQGWNKFCITGGIVEFRAKLPGKPQIGGLWPALWMLGNLARASYVGSSDYMWPWSYNKCDKLNQLSQEISACQKVHHYGLYPYMGRGAPEIDVLEAMGGAPGKLPHTPIQRPYFSTSLQIAPGIRNNRPQVGNLPPEGHWYHGMEYSEEDGNTTGLNPFFYGVTLVHKQKSYTYQSDALSANTQIGASHFSDYHTYRVEWEPSDADGKGGYIKWYSDDKFLYGINAQVLNFTGAAIPNEPMYLLINTAVSSDWGFPKPCPEFCDCECYECGNPDCECGFPDDFCSNFPNQFEVDYVRVYQAVNDSKHELGCSTESHPTEQFIKGHEKRYMEKGQKQPLLNVQNGGGTCDSDEDCGSGNGGRCTRNVCVCNEGNTGPMCMAYAGFDDNPFSHEDGSLTLSSFVLPGGFIGFAAIVIMGLVAVLIKDVVMKKKHESTKNTNGTVSPSPSYYYQGKQSMPQPLAANPQQKVVTYCMIDGKLVGDNE